METIIRKPGERDREYIDGQGNKIGTFIKQEPLSVQQKFKKDLIKYQAEATKESKPFAMRVAQSDFDNEYKAQITKQLEEYGSIKFPEKIKLPKLDWNKYSDLKNFELINEDEVFDEHLTKINPGLHVVAWKKVYKFKGYSNTYTIMEDGPSSIRRAQLKRDTEMAEAIKKANEK